MSATFEQAASAVIRALRRGEIATYGEVAEESGHPGAARAVGNVLARSEGLPWWRVVGANGRLVSTHRSEQAERLRAEGWEVSDHRIHGRAVAGLPPSLSHRRATGADASVVAGLIAACERADLGVVEIDGEDVQAEWARPSFDPARDARLVLDGGVVVAEAEVYRARRAQVLVHPDYRARGVGSALLEWTEGHAAQMGGTRVGQTVADETGGARELFESRGYRPLWTSWILSIDLTGPPPPPELPPGVGIRSYRPGDAAAVHRLVEDAFGRWVEREPTTFDDWAAVAIRRPSFRPELLPVAVDEDEIVGMALGVDYHLDEGWVQTLAVRASHRGRGLGRALLQHAFGIFHGLGRTRCGLSTDSRTGALGLYEHVGMEVTRSYTHHVRDLRPPAEGSRLS